MCERERAGTAHGGAMSGAGSRRLGERDCGGTRKQVRVTASSFPACPNLYPLYPNHGFSVHQDLKYPGPSHHMEYAALRVLAQGLSEF